MLSSPRRLTLTPSMRQKTSQFKGVGSMSLKLINLCCQYSCGGDIWPSFCEWFMANSFVPRKASMSCPKIPSLMSVCRVFWFTSSEWDMVSSIYPCVVTLSYSNSRYSYTSAILLSVYGYIAGQRDVCPSLSLLLALFSNISFNYRGYESAPFSLSLPLSLCISGGGKNAHKHFFLLWCPFSIHCIGGESLVQSRRLILLLSSFYSPNLYFLPSELSLSCITCYCIRYPVTIFKMTTALPWLCVQIAPSRRIGLNI